MRVRLKLIVLFGLGAILATYYHFYVFKDSVNEDINEKILFLKSSKHIQRKDFPSLLESIILEYFPRKSSDIESNTQESALQSLKNAESKSDSNPNVAEKPLRLLATLNNEIYINNKWYKLNDKIMYMKNEYVIKKILSDRAVLVDSKNTKNSIILEIFSTSGNVDFREVKSKVISK